MRKNGVNERMIKAIESIYEETICKVRANEKESERFWTKKGLRQGCPLSPTLFAMYIADIESTLKNAQAGGAVVGKLKVWSLAYADDLVLIAMDVSGMKEMIKSLEKYVRRKKLEVNVDKTKIMTFMKGGGRRRVEEWKWGGQKLEEVKNFKYLGYNLQANNSDTLHIKELAKKGNKSVAQIWGIGERIFGGEIKKRMSLYKSLTRSILLYGAEIWGWEEQKELNAVQDKYGRWLLGVERETPWYIIEEELKMENLRIGAGKRAVKFEEKVRERGECKLLQECMKEMNRRKENGKVGEKRERYYERTGYAGCEVERLREEGMRMCEMIVTRDKDVQLQERRERIRKSRYNAAYERLICEGIPSYLNGKYGREERKMIARFRVGNEVKANKFWMDEDKRGCRLCGECMESIEHLRKGCTELKEREESEVELLGERGQGLEWMKSVQEARERRRRHEH